MDLNKAKIRHWLRVADEWLLAAMLTAVALPALIMLAVWILK